MMIPSKLHTMENRVKPQRKRTISSKRAQTNVGAPTVRSSSQGNQDPFAAYRSPTGQIKPILKPSKPLQRSSSTSNKLGAKPLRSSSKENATTTTALANKKLEKVQTFTGSFHPKQEVLDTETDSQFATITTQDGPAHLELAKTIFEKAVKRYGTKLHYRQVDSLIKRSELKDQVDKVSRKRLKSLLYSYEHNGFDAVRAVQQEVVKFECSKLARAHYRNTLMSKVLCSLVQILINKRRRTDPQAAFTSYTSANNTTLNRMLEGVFSTSREDTQLEEFIQIERSLETQESEALASEPGLISDKKPPLVFHEQQQQEAPSMSRLHQKARASLKQSSVDSVQQKFISGIQSPSVQDLQGDFQAFCEPKEHVDSQKMLLQSTLNMTSILSKDALPLNATFNLTKNATTSFILGRDGTLGRNDVIDQKNTHLKIAQLLKTNPMTSMETQIDDQIKRLDLDPFSDDDEKKVNKGAKNQSDKGHIIASFFFRQTLLRKTLKAWAKQHRIANKSQKQRTARFQTQTNQTKAVRDASQNSGKQQKSSLKAPSKKPKVEEQEIPVKQKQQKSKISEMTYETAPKIQSCMSSPMSRLRSILTDKDSKRVLYSHQTSRRQSQSPNRTDLDQWQTQDSRQLYVLEQSGVRLRTKSLKRLAFKCLEYNQHLSNLKALTADRHFKKSVIKHLRQFVFKKRKHRSILQLYEQNHLERLVVNAFRNWRGRFFEAQISSQFRRQSLLKQGFEVLLEGTIHAAQARRISIVCRQHFKGRFLSQIISAWGQIADQNKVKRRKRKAIKEHMSTYWKKKCVKAWFNTVDLLKHEQAAQRDMLASRVKRLKRHFFVIWLAKYCKAEKRRQNHSKLVSFTTENFTKRYFGPWLNLTRRKLAKRDKFYRLRALHLYQKAFYGFKENLYNSNGDRQRTRNIVLMRASRLIRTAFYDGFIAYRQQREGMQIANTKAFTFNASNLAVKSFQALSQNYKLGQKAKLVSKKVDVMTTVQLFSEWFTLTKGLQKAKKMRTRVLVERQFQVIKALYEYANRSKVKKAQINYCLEKYSQRLIRLALSSLSENVVTRQARRDIIAQIDGYYLGKVQAKAVLAFKANTVQQQANARMINRFRVEQEDKGVSNAFQKLKNYRLLQQFKRSYKPVLANKQQWIKEQCLNVLREWKANKKELKSKLSDYVTYRQECSLENAFETLLAYTRYSKLQKQRNADAQALLRNNLLTKAMQTLIMHKICKDNQKELTQEVHKIRRKVRFITWFNLVHDDLPAMRKADEFYLRSKFTAIRFLAVKNRSERARRHLLKQLSAEYYPYMLKKRGVLKWQRVADRQVYVATQLEKFRQFRLRQLFNGWYDSNERLRDGKCRHVMQVELNKRFQFRRGLTALREYADQKLHLKSIVKIFRAKHDMIEKARIFSGLVTGNYKEKVDMKKFLAKMTRYSDGILGEAFTHWKNNLILAKKDDLAGLYYEKRATLFVLRKFFDKLRVKAHVNTNKGLTVDWTQKIRESALKRQCFTNLALYTKMRVKQHQAFAISAQRSRQRLLKLALNALAGKAFEKQRLSIVEQGLVAAFNKVRQRKVLLALQSYTARQIRARVVSERWGLRIKNKFLCRWQDRMHDASKIHRMCSILQEQSALKFIQAFMLKLEDAGHYMVFRKHLNKKLMGKALSVLKQKWLLGKMSQSLFKKHELDLQRKVLMAFRLNQIDRVNLRMTVEQQAELQNEEDNFDIKRACFQAFKENRFHQKATRVARGTFALGILRKTFNALLAWNLKRKVLAVNYREYMILKKQRILHKWLDEFDKKQKEHEAGAIIKFDKAHQVMQAWKKFVHNEKLIREFRGMNYDLALKKTVISSLQKNFVIENFQKMMATRIEKRQAVELKREAFKALRAGTKLRSIQARMKEFYLHQFTKKVVKAWKKVVDTKNFHRISLIRQRAAFIDRPYLAKPLLAWRNPLLFKAFRSIMLNANRRKEIAYNRQICTFSIYLRVQRKAFYALRLNAAARYQKKKSKEIKRLMIQRRWFTYLKRIVQGIKQKRKQNTDAAIFRFLSLQRRGFIQWVDFVSKMKRVQIKRHFAMTLYYNRMCDKVLTALKVNAKVKRRKRKELSQDTGYITTSSSEIMQEASFTHRTKLNMSSLQQVLGNSSSHNLLSNLNQINQIVDEHQFTQGLSTQQAQQLTNVSETTGYQNFYQKPINQVENAMKMASEDYLRNLPFDELHETDLIKRQMHGGVGNSNGQQASLPTPQTNNQFPSHAQQLTLGTGPENQNGFQSFQHQESYQTQQWQQHQQQPCQLCLQQVPHEHVTDKVYRKQHNYDPYDNTQMPQVQGYIADAQDQLSSFLEYRENASSQVSMDYEPVHRADGVQMVPERDYQTLVGQQFNVSQYTNSSIGGGHQHHHEEPIADMFDKTTPNAMPRCHQYGIEENFFEEDTDQTHINRTRPIVNMGSLTNGITVQQNQVEESRRTTPKTFSSPNIESRQQQQVQLRQTTAPHSGVNSRSASQEKKIQSKKVLSSNTRKN